MSWVKFENPKQLERFLEAFRSLYQPVLTQLPAAEQPWFTHFWLQQLNLSDCHIWDENGETFAVVAYPKTPDIHYYRWQTPSLAVRSGFELPELPRPIEKDSVNFYTPLNGASWDHGVKIKSMAVQPSQYCTAIRIADRLPEAFPIAGIEYRIVGTANDAEDAVQVFQSRVPEFGADDFYNSYYLPMICREVQQIPHGGDYLCVLAVDSATGAPMAAASYSAWELPLGGSRAVLVDDIFVLSKFRRRGIAASLQAFAYRELRRREVSWVCGNIKRDNAPSLRQSEKLGRKPWSVILKVTRT